MYVNCSIYHSNKNINLFFKTIEQDTSFIINTESHNQVPLMVTASLLGLVSLFLLVVAIVAGIYISYRLCKRDKKVVRYV